MPAPKGHEAYNKNGEGGRPLKYTEEFINAEGDALEEWMRKKENIFLEDFSHERGYSYTRCLEWAKHNERFSCIYERFQERQKVILFKGGLTKKFAYPMCALILSNSHGIVAKTEQKLTGSATDPLSFVLDKIDGKSKEFVDESERD